MNMPITFSIVVPVFNSEPYLPDLFDSLDRQSLGDYSLECVFVDDGSTDKSQTLIRDWLERTEHAGVVLVQENRGVSSARNRGLETASGDWVGFPDSDDFLGPNYFSSIARSLRSVGEDRTDLVSSNVIRYFEAANTYDRRHNLSYKFRSGTVLVDLDEAPEFIQTQAASAMFRRKPLLDNSVRFITGLHAAEDALFVANYLRSLPSRRILCVAEAEYIYRKRAAANSAVDRFRENPDFYFGRFRDGYLPLLEQAHQSTSVPDWLANLYLYDLRWFFPREQSVIDKARHLDEDEKAEVIELVGACLRHIEERTIVNYRVTSLSAELRYLFLALKGSALLSDHPAKVVSMDSRCVEIRYLFMGEAPEERLDGPASALTPFAAKTRQLDYFSQDVLKERVIRVPRAGTVTLTLGGRETPLASGEYEIPRTDAVGQALLKHALLDCAESQPTSPAQPFARRLKARLRREIAFWMPAKFANTPDFQAGMDLRERRHTAFVRLTARRTAVGRRFLNAWVFMDGVESANGSGEAFYWQVRDGFNDVNAWFVIREGTSDWSRLSARGAKLVAYGSVAHKHLLSYARIVFSSEAGPGIVEPMPSRYYTGSRPWRFVCLHDHQTREDWSIVYNHAPIDLLVTATADERDAIVHDGSPYTLTEDSVRVTGSPKVDALGALAEPPMKRSRPVLLGSETGEQTATLKRAHGEQEPPSARLIADGRSCERILAAVRELQLI
ncbi:Glycosyltransferase involved in cell wall bisynthesis [Paramicrobacterium humi]|uniref:Glycosyltransferase involved in cell wall bisynthesis n=1 Tax=Paramicrobacterium humi TaxID=640635 RepID=A0A1H4ISR1_9MICO|nr:glycosyltransferase family 2 protein [Microbacterium humi]SEB36686.1 Glycosyltransferase involved in cell wall bisynthesis [Microbacterium humi]